METTVINEDNPYYDTEGGNDTKDKVYLLSIAEVANAVYGLIWDSIKVQKQGKWRIRIM